MAVAVVFVFRLIGLNSVKSNENEKPGTFALAVSVEACGTSKAFLAHS